MDNVFQIPKAVELRIFFGKRKLKAFYWLLIKRLPELPAVYLEFGTGQP